MKRIRMRYYIKKNKMNQYYACDRDVFCFKKNKNFCKKT